MRASIILAIAAALLTTSCMQKSSGQGTYTQPDQPKPSLFEVPQNQLANLKIAPVGTAAWSPVVRTSGTVDWDADHTTQAITQVSGPISRLLVDTGAIVKTGQPLLYVSSADAAGAVATYKKAINRMEYSKRTLDRNKDLLEHKVIAQKDLEAAEQDYNDARVEVENDLQALKIFGITQAEIDNARSTGTPIDPQLAVRSPIGGMIVQKLVTPGLVIQAGTTACFTISDTSTVWVWGHVYDRELESVRVGDSVDLSSGAFRETFHGTINYIGALLDPATRTTPVRIVTQNPRGLLKKDMFLDAVIHTRAGHNVLAAPTSAILRNEDNLPFVYVEVSPGRFAQRLVTLGGQQGSLTEVTGGLKPGERIVTEGSVFLQFANSTQ